jgi:hypothetical protein
MPKNKKIKIKLSDWEHTCGDGCCTTFGTDVFIDGIKVSQGDYYKLDLILDEVLRHLGFITEIECE